MRKITIGDLLRTSYMSRSTYLRLFSKTTGYTPGEYINRYRIDKAKKMLKEGERTMVHIAQSIGLCDSSHFSRLFKKHTRLSPKEYREMALK